MQANGQKMLYEAETELTVYHEFEFNQIQHYELQKLPLRLEVMFPCYIKL